MIQVELDCFEDVFYVPLTILQLRSTRYTISEIEVARPGLEPDPLLHKPRAFKTTPPLHLRYLDEDVHYVHCVI